VEAEEVGVVEEAVRVAVGAARHLPEPPHHVRTEGLRRVPVVEEGKRVG